MWCYVPDVVSCVNLSNFPWLCTGRSSTSHNTAKHHITPRNSAQYRCCLLSESVQFPVAMHGEMFHELANNLDDIGIAHLQSIISVMLYYMLCYVISCYVISSQDNLDDIGIAHLCYEIVARVLQECYKSFTRVLQECYKVLEECYKSVTRVCKSVTRVLQECCKRVARVLQECCKSVARVLQECCKNIAGVLNLPRI
jgi:hypothetical protein